MNKIISRHWQESLHNLHHQHACQVYQPVIIEWLLSMFGYALELVRKAKDGVTQEYIHLVRDLRVK